MALLLHSTAHHSIGVDSFGGFVEHTRFPDAWARTEYSFFHCHSSFRKKTQSEPCNRPWRPIRFHARSHVYYFTHFSLPPWLITYRHNWLYHVQIMEDNVTCLGDRPGFGLVIWFINNLQVVTTNNYYTIADFHTTIHSTLIFQSISTSLHYPLPGNGFITREL
jgi:hypothetical protein